MERQNRPEKTKDPVSKKISEQEKSEERFRKSEVERVKFLEKYYPRLKKSYEEVKPTENVHTEGGCTPKRSRYFEFLEMGENESPSKRRKVNSQKQENKTSNPVNILNLEDLD